MSPTTDAMVCDRDDTAVAMFANSTTAATRISSPARVLLVVDLTGDTPQPAVSYGVKNAGKLSSINFISMPNERHNVLVEREVSPDSVKDEVSPDGVLVEDEVSPGSVKDEVSPYGAKIEDEISPDSVLVDDEISPYGVLVEDEVSPDVVLADDEISPYGVLVEDEVSPDVVLVEDEVSPDVVLVEDDVSPDVVLVEDEVSPGSVKDEDSPDGAKIEDEISPYGVLVEDEVSPDGVLIEDEVSPDVVLVVDEVGPDSVLVEDEVGPDSVLMVSEGLLAATEDSELCSNGHLNSSSVPTPTDRQCILHYDPLLSGTSGGGSQLLSRSSSLSTSQQGHALEATSEPNFSAMPVSELRSVVLSYGLKIDCKASMIRLLSAMWHRLHPGNP